MPVAGISTMPIRGMKSNTLKSLQVRNLLSFGNDSPRIELGNLNVLIGPNGSGKSNLIEIIGLLRSTPKDLAAAIGDRGGVDEWLWKGKSGDKSQRLPYKSMLPRRGLTKRSPTSFRSPVQGLS